MKTSTLPLNKNPAWVNMGDYASFNDALAAMRYYDERHERWLAIRHKVTTLLVKSWTGRTPVLRATGS